MLLLLLLDMSVFIGLFLLVLGANGGYGCTCYPSHPQQLFCDAGFAIHGVVTSETPAPIYADIEDGESTVKQQVKQVYEIIILKVFKGKEALLGIPTNGNQLAENDLPTLVYSTVNITTPYGESMCGIDLIFQTQYLIFGKNKDGELQTDLCDFSSDWEEVEDQTKRGVLGEYDCRCQVEAITAPEDLEQDRPDSQIHYTQSKNNTCIFLMNPSEMVDECAMNFLTCRKLVTPIRTVETDTSESCVWVQGKEYLNCLLP